MSQQCQNINLLIRNNYNKNNDNNKNDELSTVPVTEGSDSVSSGSIPVQVFPSSSDTDESGLGVCRLTLGKVCICVTCEATRERMINRNTSIKRRRTFSISNDQIPPVSISSDASMTMANSIGAIKKPRTTSGELDKTVVFSKQEQREQENYEVQLKIEKMQQACRTILECIGENPAREGLVKTPDRWAKALLFLTQGYKQNFADVANGAVFEENHDEMVVVRDIDIHSLCEHHMLPFSGRVHVGYIPNGKIIGLSKLARIADMFARRLQVQERLTRQIADAIVEAVNPLGVGVVVECAHFCMVMRGVQKVGATTVTSSVRGCFEKNPKTRAEFFSIIHKGQGKLF